MAKYVYLYHGGKMGGTPEEMEASMAAWKAWMVGMGANCVDMGTPFKGSMWVKGDGSTVAGTMSADSVSGYTIVEAESMDQATEWAKGCPILKEGGSLEVMDPMPMPAM